MLKELERRIDRYVQAADNLVNLLRTEPQPRPVMVRVHQQAIERAMDEYDAARRDLVGNDEEEE